MVEKVIETLTCQGSQMDGPQGRGWVLCVSGEFKQSNTLQGMDTYPTWGKGKSSSKVPFWRDMLVPWRVTIADRNP